MRSDRIKELSSLMRSLNISKLDIKLLNQALTHPSYAMEHQENGDNQRLEFLGDAVIDLLMGEYLYNAFPNYNEGELTKMRASLVCEASLAEGAMKLGLDKYLLLGRGEAASGGATRPSNLADAWESVCGAIYLCAGIEALKPMVYANLEDVINRVKNGYYGDYKTRLQEFIQREQGHTVVYRLIEETGPAHDKRFHIEVLIDDISRGSGWGRSKKIAEREAALAALNYYGQLSAKDEQ